MVTHVRRLSCRVSALTTWARVREGDEGVVLANAALFVILADAGIQTNCADASAHMTRAQL
jgi:hypothetical protein